MNTLKQKIKFYQVPEDRKWKRVWHCFELVFISIACMSGIVVLQVYGDGSKLQPVLMLFSALLSISALALTYLIYYSNERYQIARWQLQLIVLGLGSGAGIAAVAVLTLLDSQY